MTHWKTTQRQSPSLREFLDVARDLLLIASIPFVLLTVFFTVSPDMRRSFAFQMNSPDAVTVYTATYIHMEWGHLRSNLTGYTLLSLTCYTLCVRSQQKQLFYTSFLVFTLAYPVILTASNIGFSQDSTAYGFSGVIFAFHGFLAVALATFIHTRTGGDLPGKEIAPIVFLLGAAFITTRVTAFSGINRDLPTLTVSLVTINLLFYLYQFLSNTHVSRVPNYLKRSVLTTGSLGLITVSVVVFLVSLSFGFPSTVQSSNGTVNVYTHFLGYAFGFFSTYIVWVYSTASHPLPLEDHTT